MSDKRIHAEIVSVSENKIVDWFDNFFDQEQPMESVMLQKGHLDLTHNRNNQDYNTLVSNYDIHSISSVLDIGCGYGRWLDNLLNHIKIYDGIDGSAKTINYAKKRYEKYLPNFRFHQCFLNDLDLNILNPHYDLIIFNGILMYLNDETILNVLKKLESLIKQNTIIYVRESVSCIKEEGKILNSNSRLTLKEWKSDISDINYNVIYRTVEEYQNLFRQIFPNLSIINSGYINTDTCKYKDTNQFYWIFKIHK